VPTPLTTPAVSSELTALVAEFLARDGEAITYIRAGYRSAAGRRAFTVSALRDAPLRGIDRKPPRPARTYIASGHRILPVPTFEKWGDV
jgi:hypothetical protein